LKDLTVSATLRKMMDFSEMTGDPRGASRPESLDLELETERL
jgi:hypothetical protein